MQNELCFNPLRFAMVPFRQTSTGKIGKEERETAYMGWISRWKHWDGFQNLDSHTQTVFMDMEICFFFEEARCKASLNEAIDRVSEESSVRMEPSLLVWCGGEERGNK